MLIQLTQIVSASTEREVFVNSDHIVFVRDYKGNTKIDLANPSENTDSIVVKETLSEVNKKVSPNM